MKDSYEPQPGDGIEAKVALQEAIARYDVIGPPDHDLTAADEWWAALAIIKRGPHFYVVNLDAEMFESPPSTTAEEALQFTRAEFEGEVWLQAKYSCREPPKLKWVKQEPCNRAWVRKEGQPPLH